MSEELGNGSHEHEADHYDDREHEEQQRPHDSFIGRD
jgi:hypothetical protein